MEKRDYLMYQIEQMGKVLAQVLSTFLGLKSKGEVDEGIKKCNEQLQTELDIDIEFLLTRDKAALKSFFANTNFTDQHLEILASYLEEAGKSKANYDKESAASFLQKAMLILETADELSGTLSFERMQRIEKLKRQLVELG